MKVKGDLPGRNGRHVKRNKRLLRPIEGLREREVILDWFMALRGESLNTEILTLLLIR